MQLLTAVTKALVSANSLIHESVPTYLGLVLFAVLFWGMWLACHYSVTFYWRPLFLLIKLQFLNCCYNFTLYVFVLVIYRVTWFHFMKKNKTEVALQRCFKEKVFWKYTANLHFICFFLLSCWQCKQTLKLPLILSLTLLYYLLIIIVDQNMSVQGKIGRVISEIFI